MKIRSTSGRFRARALASVRNHESEFENFPLCERFGAFKKKLYSIRSCVNWAFLA
jgi:hypothetical protein